MRRARGSHSPLPSCSPHALPACSSAACPSLGMRKQAQQATMHELGASPRWRRQRRAGPTSVAAGFAALLVATAATLLLLSRTLGVFCPTNQSGGSGGTGASGTLGQQLGEAAGGGIAARRPLRVLLVGHELTLTGAPLALLEIATHLRDRGHRVE